MAMSPTSSFCFMFLFLYSTLFSATTVCFPTSLSYSHHCASLVPESTPTAPSTTTFPQLNDRILHNNDDYISSEFSFKSGEDFWFTPTQNVFETNTPGVHMIEAYLFVPPRGFFTWNHEGNRLLRFELDGFWSQYSGKLCMVGSASWHSRGGNLINLDAVLKLNYAMNLTIFSGLITGKLESLASPNDPNYFEPVPMLEYVSSSNYKYSLVSGQFDSDCHGGIDTPKNQSLGLHSGSFCSTMMKGRRKVFTLEYLNECSSSKNCNPLGKDELPTEMTLKVIQCSEEEQKVQYVIKLGSPNQPFDPSRTLVGEASWDEKKNQLCIVACRLLSSSGSQEDVHIGDCSIRLSLRYPAFWSIWNRTSIVGQIWTNKTSNDFGYFHRIALRSQYNSAVEVPGLSYEYLLTNKVRKLCPFNNPIAKTEGDRYPKGNSRDLAFFLEARGYGELQAVPNFVGDEVYEPDNPFRSSRSISTHDGPLNVSYTISQSSGKSSHSLLHISAEGLYDEETGSLCMVGCRKISSTVESDCVILIKFQFEPVNAKKGGQVRGSIESLREETDPLYFKQGEKTATLFDSEEAKRSLWQLDLEIVLVIITNTLACVFVGLQLLYVKRNPQLRPFVSVVMLLLLTLGHMIPLLLNFASLFLGNRKNEMVVTVTTMPALLLQFGLLQQVFFARLADEKGKGLWLAETRALFHSPPLYILVLLFVLSHSEGMVYSSSVVYDTQYLWRDLKRYGGWVLDIFLLPQILLNIFQISTMNALSPPFYIGTTCVRLLPHAYDLYRTYRILANPDAEIYLGCTWDVLVSCGCVLLAVAIHLQQRFGGLCMFPLVQDDKKVPEISDEQQITI